MDGEAGTIGAEIGAGIGAGIGAALKRLRTLRGLSLSEAGRRSGVSRMALSEWENGGRLPRGAALGRVLDVLDADDRLRARLLHAADPAYARVALLRSSLGPSVSLGGVLRAMRARRGITQAEFARAVGVAQTTVARWESSDSLPDAATTHAALFALGASAEEAVAAASAAGRAPIDLGDDLREAHRRVGVGISTAPRELRDVVALGFEAEVWRRASRDPRWDTLLCEIVGQNANRHFGMGRVRETRTEARRALRLATTPETRVYGVAAVGTLSSLARQEGVEPGAILRGLEGWAERLPPTRGDCNYRSWLSMSRGHRLAEMGRLEEAEASMARAAELVETGEEERRRLHVDWTIDVRLRAGRPERALDLVARSSSHGLTSLLQAATAYHANGRPVPEAWMEGIRAEIRDPEHDRIRRNAVEEVERIQARFLGRGAS